MKKTFQAVDLGQAQAESVNASKAYKAAQTALAKAIEVAKKTEAAHVAAQKTLAAAFESVCQATKVL